MTILDGLDAEPELTQVYGRMGFKPRPAEIPESLRQLVDEAIQSGRELSEPLACYDFRPIKIAGTSALAVDGRFSISSQKVFQWMAGCHGLYLCAVTIGPRLDRKVAELSAAGKMTQAFLLNAYGAEAAEALLHQLNKTIIRMCRDSNLETTKRYSPGYGDWPISAQKDLLGTLQAERIGIRLTEKYIMIPEKSVSAIIGRRGGNTEVGK